MLSVEDLRELGVPMGPRKKLAELISREKERVDRVQVCGCGWMGVGTWVGMHVHACEHVWVWVYACSVCTVCVV